MHQIVGIDCQEKGQAANRRDEQKPFWDEWQEEELYYSVFIVFDLTTI